MTIPDRVALREGERLGCPGAPRVHSFQREGVSPDRLDEALKRSDETRLRAVRIAESALVLLGVAFLSGCSDTDRLGGVVFAVPGDGDQWIVGVDLDDAEIAGSASVQVLFEASELSCAGGGLIAPEQVYVSQEISFERVGDDATDEEHPIISGENLEVDCSN